MSYMLPRLDFARSSIYSTTRQRLSARFHGGLACTHHEFCFAYFCTVVEIIRLRASVVHCNMTTVLAQHHDQLHYTDCLEVPFWRLAALFKLCTLDWLNSSSTSGKNRLNKKLFLKRRQGQLELFRLQCIPRTQTQDEVFQIYRLLLPSVSGSHSHT